MAAPRQAIRCLRASNPLTTQFMRGRIIPAASSTSPSPSSRPFSATSSQSSPPQPLHDAASSSSNTGNQSDRETHFGYETVTESEKTQRVAGVFTSVAETYDRMNDLMSFGWHRVWK